MKITVNQLRRIIKEEVKRSLLKETSEASLEIPNDDISVMSSPMGRPSSYYDGYADDFIRKIKKIVDNWATLEVEEGNEFLKITEPGGDTDEIARFAEDLDEKFAGMLNRLELSYGEDNLPRPRSFKDFIKK